MLQFSKYQGLGNGFILVEGRDGRLPESITSPDADWVRKVCDRRFGLGGDGLILALPPQGQGDLRMRIFNADGSEAEMCGNGIRCLARFLADSDGDLPGRSWKIETPAGQIIPELQQDGQIRVDMGAPFLKPEAVPTLLSPDENGLPRGEVTREGLTLSLAAVGMGNPHVVVPVDDLETIPFEALGAQLECDPIFPAKTKQEKSALSPSENKISPGLRDFVSISLSFCKSSATSFPIEDWLLSFLSASKRSS